MADETQEPTLEQLKAQLAEMEAAATKANTEAEQQKFVNQRQQRELDAQRRQWEQFQSQANTQDNGQEDDPIAARISQIEKRFASYQEENDIDRFKRNTGVGDDDMAEVLRMINDPMQSADLITFNQDSTANVYRSLKRAHDQLEIKRLREFKAKSEAAKQELEAKNAAANKHAVISGGGAAETKEDVDLSQMSSDDMLKQGLVPDLDPDDPIRPRGR
jgi:hypothetical protein